MTLHASTMNPSTTEPAEFPNPLRSAARTIAAASAAAGLALLAVACGDSSSSARADQPRQQKPPVQVRTERVAERPLSTSVTVSGSLAAFDRAEVSTKVAGRLQRISVDLGSQVSTGMVIAQIDPTDYQFRVSQAEASLMQARVRLGLDAAGAEDRVDPADTPPVREASAILEETRANRARFATLFESGLVSKAAFDQVVANTRVAESRYADALDEIQNRQAVMMQRRAEVALARQQLNDTSIRASFSGVVERRAASVGEFLAAGAPVAVIVKVDPLRFRAEVPERDAANVRVGQSVQLSVDGASGSYTGRVTRLSPTITERTRVLIMEADVPNSGQLRAGSFARAQITTNTSESTLTVPTAALITFAGIQKVIVVEKEKISEKAVTTGRRAGQWTEVLSGVKSGDEVVLEPGNLSNGQQVVVRK